MAKIDNGQRPVPRRSRLQAMADSPWALLPSTLSRIVEWGKHEDHGTAPVVALSGPHGGATHAGTVAVIPVYGVIEHRSDWMMEMFGGVSVDGLRESLRAELADPAVKAIVLDIDSPGGAVSGLTELAAEIRSARGGAKPIVAVANTLAASAAYWLAAQADELVVTPSGQVGSVGVYAVHQDVSRMLDDMGVTTTIVSAGPHKTEGNEFEPLTEAARADLQARVDGSYEQFIADVAAGRRVSADKVREDYGGGRVLPARKALAAGMVDRVDTLAATIGRLGSAASRRRLMSAEEAGPEMVAEDDGPVPFAERLAVLVTEAESLVAHAQERARLRSKEGRAAFSTTTERSLWAIRAAVDALIPPDEPATAPPDPVEPVVVAPVTPPVAAPTPRPVSRAEFVAKIEAMTR